MSGIQIIVDSTCDLDPLLIQNTDLKILPLTISLGDENYLDGESITVSEIYERMRNNILPKTSQIPYYRIHDLFKSVLDSGGDFMYIAFSGELSGCYELASMIAEELCGQYPGQRGVVIDSQGGSSATGIIVLQALRMARDGLSFEIIESNVRFMVENVEHVFSVDDLKWLAKGGRIPNIVGYVGSKLRLHPILDVEKGRMILRRMVQGKNKAIRVIADEIVRRAKMFPNQLIAISHADDPEAAKTLAEHIRLALPECSTTTCHIGGVLGAHIGLKGIGAFCLSQRPDQYRFE